MTRFNFPVILHYVDVVFFVFLILYSLYFIYHMGRFLNNVRSMKQYHLDLLSENMNRGIKIERMKCQGQEIAIKLLHYEDTMSKIKEIIFPNSGDTYTSLDVLNQLSPYLSELKEDKVKYVRMYNDLLKKHQSLLSKDNEENDNLRAECNKLAGRIISLEDSKEDWRRKYISVQNRMNGVWKRVPKELRKEDRSLASVVKQLAYVWDQRVEELTLIPTNTKKEYLSNTCVRVTDETREEVFELYESVGFERNNTNTNAVDYVGVAHKGVYNQHKPIEGDKVITLEHLRNVVNGTEKIS